MFYLIGWTDMRYVYGLGDPTECRIRYIGQSNNVQRRYREHIEDDDNTLKCDWIRNLQRRGHQPYLIVLDNCPDAEIDTLEAWWIRFGTSKGWQLTNSTFTGMPRKKRPDHELIKTLRLVAVLILILFLIYITRG